MCIRFLNHLLLTNLCIYSNWSILMHPYQPLVLWHADLREVTLSSTGLWRKPDAKIIRFLENRKSRFATLNRITKLCFTAPESVHHFGHNRRVAEEGLVKIGDHSILNRQLDGISFSQFTCSRSTVSSLHKTRSLSLCAKSAFTGNSDHSQVKIARLVFIETEMLFPGAEVSADAGYKFQSDWWDCLPERGFATFVPSCKCICNPWPHAVNTSLTRA